MKLKTNKTFLKKQRKKIKNLNNKNWNLNIISKEDQTLIFKARERKEKNSTNKKTTPPPLTRATRMLWCFQQHNEKMFFYHKEVLHTPFKVHKWFPHINECSTYTDNFFIFYYISFFI